MGNGEAKELVHMTHGHELMWGNECLWERGIGQRGTKERKMGQL